MHSLKLVAESGSDRRDLRAGLFTSNEKNPILCRTEDWLGSGTELDTAKYRNVS